MADINQSTIKKICLHGCVSAAQSGITSQLVVVLSAFTHRRQVQTQKAGNCEAHRSCELV